jgi:hypothetical protein
MPIRSRARARISLQIFFSYSQGTVGVASRASRSGEMGIARFELLGVVSDVLHVAVGRNEREVDRHGRPESERRRRRDHPGNLERGHPGHDLGHDAPVGAE